MMDKKMVFDISITGHHSEYIGHLVNYLSFENHGEIEYYFVVHPDFAATFPKIYEKAANTESILWCPITKKEFEKVHNAQKVWSSMLMFQLIKRYAKRNQVKHVFALDFHSIKYGGILNRQSYTISSILFLQFHRLKRETQKQHMEFYKRYYTTKLCLRNPNITKIFVLNDEETVDYMNKEFKTDRFQMLPDPIPSLEPLENFDIHDHYGIDKDRKIFLHIGSLGHRKGTQEAMEAASHIDPSRQSETAILIVGRTSNTEDEKLFSEKMEAMKKTTSVQLVWDNQFVPSNMMKSLFDQCDTVLLPYKNAEFSSGILGHAAAAQKRVIATGAGLIKELVMRYQLGELLEIPDAQHIAKKIDKVLKDDAKSIGQTDFVEEHSPEKFAETLFEA
ncbi:MAG: glycosyltransferase [Pricia sp.]